MKRKRTLNSDQLGKKGESRFPELCVDAGLVPNASTWDRRGWDFIVDWPHGDGSQAYDTRPAPLSCLVQLKTVWTSSKAVKLRLSSAEFIAKDSRPTFLYAFRVADDLSFADARLAHLKGDLLALILQELRRARLAGKELNDVEIRIPLDKWFEPLPVDGPSLRSAIERLVGPSLASYGKEKQRQLRELGYEGGGLLISTTFRSEDVEHIAEAFLGLRRIGFAGGDAVDRRFGLDIPIPELNMTSGFAEITPQPRDTCIITANEGAFRFKGKVFGVPNGVLPADQLRLLIRTELFDLLLRGRLPQSGTPTLGLTMRTDGGRIGDLRTTASNWADFYGFVEALGGGRLRLEIKLAKVEQPLAGMASIDGEDHAERWRRPARLSRIAADVLSRAGWPGTALRVQDIGDAGGGLEMLAAMIDDPSELTRLSFQTDPMPGVVEGGRFDMLYFDRFALGGHCMVYAVEIALTARLEEGRIVWTGGVPRFRDLKRVKCADVDYGRYVEALRKRTGIGSYYAAHWETSDPEGTATGTPLIERQQGLGTGHGP